MSSVAMPLDSHTSAPARRWWDVPAVLLLLISLFIAASRLIVTDWVDHLSLVQMLVVLGVIAGLALGRSRFSPGLVTLLVVVYGLFAITWRMTLIVSDASGILWRDRLIVLAWRLLDTIGQVVQREPVQDPVLFLSSMAALFWALGAYAGYTLTRYAHPWRIIIPAGLTTLIIHTSDPYVPRRAWYLAAYLFFSLLLLFRLTYLRLRVHWEQADALVPPLVAWDFSYIILLVALFFVLLAWMVPTVTDVMPPIREMWQRMTRPWQERLDDVFASLRRRGGVVTVVDYYSDSFPLGRGRKLTDDLVLLVQGPPGTEFAGVRYYWRARVYDRYEDGTWSTSALSATQTINPSGLGLTFPDLEERTVVTFTFTSPSPIGTFYVAPQPRWINRRAQADLIENPDGTVDLFALHADPPVNAGEVYRTRSALSTISIAQLREAGTDYPAWVTERYLELPASITPRTRELAQQIAADHETPYDVAVAVTNFLRANIEYRETITPSLPADQDPLDWFLFDLRQGFCNYYATAEVMLLRSVGIPARLAVGFARGERQQGTNTYLVRQHNAHAWPEVYFPGLGWVEFEPTASQEPIDRLLGDIDLGDDAERESALSPDDAEDRLLSRLDELEDIEEFPETGPPDDGSSVFERARTFFYWLLLLLGLTLIVLALRTRLQGSLRPLPILLERGLLRIGWRPPQFLRRWAARAALGPLERAYLEINRALARLDVHLDLAATPAERSSALTQALPSVKEPAQQLLDEYQTAIYSPRFGNLHVARQAARAIRRLSWQARLHRLLFSDSFRKKGVGY